MLNAIKTRLINWLTINLIPVFNPDNVLRLDKFGGLYIKGEKLSPETIRNLQAEAKYFEECELWKIVNDYLNADVSDKLYKNSQTLMDLTIAKTMLYTIATQRNIISKIKNAKV